MSTQEQSTSVAGSLTGSAAFSTEQARAIGQFVYDGFMNERETTAQLTKRFAALVESLGYQRVSGAMQTDATQYDSGDIVRIYEFAKNVTQSGTSWANVYAEWDALVSELGLYRGGQTLDKMFAAQKALQARMPAFADGTEGAITHPLTGKPVSRRTLLLIENAKMAAGEAWEIHDGAPWKMHKQDFGRELTPDEVEHCIEECVDLQHFLINCLLLLGVDNAQQLEDAFFRKNAVNHERQDNGY